MNKEERVYQAESYLLAILLSEPSLLEEVRVNESHFTKYKNRALFNSMDKHYRLEPQNFDFMVLYDLPESEKLAFGGKEYIQYLIKHCPSIHSLQRYEKTMLDYWATKQAETACKNYLERIIEVPNVESLEELKNDLDNVEVASKKVNSSFSDDVKELFEYHMGLPEKGISGINTGFMRLNLLTDGWQSGDIIIIGARPSMGKTAFMLNLMVEGYQKQSETKHVFFSLEMSKRSVIARMVSYLSGVNLGKLRNPHRDLDVDEMKRYTDSLGKLSEYDFDIQETQYKVSEMRHHLRAVKKENPDKKIVAYIDFLTLMKSEQKFNSKHLEVDEIITNLKSMAKALDIPVVVLCQLSRDVEKRQDKRPSLGDLRESGSIEQVADIAMFLYRDSYYTKDKNDRTLEVIVDKFRNGSTTKLFYDFHGSTQKVVEKEPPKYE